MVSALLQLVDKIFDIYSFILVASIIYSWLYALNIINSHNQFVAFIGKFLYQVTEPVLAPIRRILPKTGTVDLSPVVVFLMMWLIRSLMWNFYNGIYI